MPTLPDFQILLPVLGFTFAQAFVSAVVAVVLGFLGALGLQWVGVRFGARTARWVEVFILIPNVAPVLIFLLAMFRFAPSLRGFAGIVIAHAFLNVGLVSAAFVRAFQDKLAGLADLAWIEGASRSRFVTRVTLPLLKGEMLAMFLFVFSICFASFAVPLMLGGSRATTIETLIWQEIRLDGHWANAVGLSIMQFGILVALAFVLGREPSTPLGSLKTNHRLLSWAGGLIFVVIPSAMIVATLLENPFSGLALLSTVDVVSKIVGSLVVAVFSGLLVVGCLMAIAYVDPQGGARRILLGTVAPSSVITGFAILFMWRETGIATLLKISIGLVLVATPAFYRLRWDSLLASLRAQRTIARTLGASDRLIFSKVVFPQAVAPACLIAGFASMWAWGDFALSRVVAEADVTLALFVQGVMGSYRLELALTLTWFLLLGSALTYFIFEGAGRVLGTKSQT